jgi:ABC-2 type transport system ATP-binding protein
MGHSIGWIARTGDRMIANDPGDATSDGSQTMGKVPANAVDIVDLAKTYRGMGKAPPKRALDGISLTVARGEMFGLLGPNGAGKSTLINIMAGLVDKTAGHVSIWGIDIDRDPRGSRAAIGVVPQELNLDAFFTPRELLEVQAGLYGVPAGERRTDEILAAVGLADKADSHARALSGGMRRRLLVAKALVHAPPVLVLDEPTAGVDVELRQQLWSYVRSLNARGVTVLLTTHYLEEAEELCGRIAIINRGRLAACDTTANLKRVFDRKTLLVTPTTPLAEAPAALASLAPELQPDGVIVFRYRPSQVQAGQILAAVQAAGIGIADVSTREADLEDVFLTFTRAA